MPVDADIKPARSRRLFRPGELARVGLAFAAFFFILCSYYMLRPVRDDMGVQFGAGNLHWLFTATFIATLLAVPLFGWVVARLPRGAILPAVYGFFIGNLLLFYAAFSITTHAMLTAGVFFVWVSVFNLFAVSLFWSNVSDAFATDEAHRLYGYIAAGGTAGALAGPAATALLARQLSTAALIGVAALLLMLAVGCMMALRRRSAVHAEGATTPVGGTLLAGVRLTLRSRPLRGVALLVICYTAVSTALYVEMIELAGNTYAASAERKAFFASVDLAVNGLSLLLQLTGTRRIVQRFGLRHALPMVPALVLAGLAVFIAWGALAGLVLVQVLQRTGEYALGRPGREMIYTTVDAESRYKAKSFIDTAVYRANDAASAWLIAAVRGIGANPVAAIGVPVALLWLWAASNVGKQHDQFNRNHQPQPA